MLKTQHPGFPAPQSPGLPVGAGAPVPVISFLSKSSPTVWASTSSLRRRSYRSKEGQADFVKRQDSQNQSNTLPRGARLTRLGSEEPRLTCLLSGQPPGGLGRRLSTQKSQAQRRERQTLCGTEHSRRIYFCNVLDKQRCSPATGK